MGTPSIQDSAEIVLDDLNLLATMARMPRTVSSDVFKLECEVRIAAAMAVAGDKEAFDDVLGQYFSQEVVATKTDAASIEKAIESGDSVSDVDLRRLHLYTIFRALVEYHKNRLMTAKPNSAVARQAQESIVDFETSHSRELLQQQVRGFLKQVLGKLRVQGAVFLEQVSRSLLDRELIITPDEYVDDEDEQAEEADSTENEVVEAEDEEMVESKESDTEDQLNSAQIEANEDEVEEVEDDAEDEDEVESPPAPAPASTRSKSRPGPPLRASSRTRATKASTNPTVVQLQAASSELKDAVADPLAEALKSTQVLSKKRRSREETKENEQEEEEDEDEDVNVELTADEIESEPSTPPKRKPGRPPKAPRYDREQKAATKVEFSDADAEEVEGEEEEEEEEEGKKKGKKKTLPSFRSKAASGVPSSSKTPAQLAPASADRTQRGRPAVHRHAIDRSGQTE